MGLVEQNSLVLSGSAKKVLLTAFSPDDKKGEEYAIYRYLKRIGVDDITAFYWGDNDIKSAIPADVKAIKIDHDGDFSEQDLKQFDLIFRHTTTRPGPLISSGVQTTSLTKEFFELCPAKIIGVTGSKGKGTTCSLVELMLKNAGINTHLVGNIGRPALDSLANIKSDDVVVYELSSFQLWDLKKSPQLAVVLLIEPEHLDVHENFEDYLNAKMNIARWQNEGDVTFYHSENQYSKRVASVGMGIHKRYLTKEGAYIEHETLKINEQDICSTNEFALYGKHNYENIAAAVSLVWQITQNIDAISNAIKTFDGLEHRLKLVGTKNGIRFIDDSIATIPSAAIAAINAFNEPKILILGGHDKGSDYNQLTEVIARNDIKFIYLIGATAEKIANLLKAKGFDKFEIIKDSMKNIVSKAYNTASKGDVILLSPACASFGDFKNYVDRADQFIEAYWDL